MADDSYWKSFGLCYDVGDPNIWFPARGQDFKTAKAICAQCPVRAACLDYALKHRIRHGIWGGKSERERRKIRSNRPFVKTCRKCGNEFETRYSHQVVCNDAACRRQRSTG